MVRKIKIVGMEYVLPKETVSFGNAVRYRISGNETQLSLAKEAVIKVLASNNLTIDDIDLIVSCSAVPTQLIPNMASLIYEQFYSGSKKAIPCMDINTTCTGFVSALDIISYLVEARRYNRVLLVASDVPSKALNINEKHSYELFSDAAVATILESSNDETGIYYAVQKTFPAGAHLTEISGGGTGITPHEMTEENKELFYFKMKGKSTVKFIVPNVKEIYTDIKSKFRKIDFIVPHQASPVLMGVFEKIGASEEYANLVNDYGNMVSASIPFALKKMIEERKIKRKDNVMLIGTAAGITINAMVLKY